MEKSEDKPNDSGDIAENKGEENSEYEVTEDRQILDETFPSKRKKDDETYQDETSQSGITLFNNL